MTSRIVFEKIKVEGFRNIAELTFEPSPGINVVSGDNGQGKTSLLEALYFVATTKSFRTEKARELIREGSDLLAVRARVVESGIAREQRVALGARTRSVQMDGKKPETLSGYATRTAVVVFHPGDLTILTGGASERRTLLDRVALFMDPASADHRLRYTRAARARKTVLEERGPVAADLGALEHLMARHGSELSRARLAAADRLIAALGPLVRSIAAPDIVVTAKFVSGGSLDAADLEAELGRRREQDLRLRSVGFGPQRDDFDVRLDGRSVRRHASQGQQRILTLALKGAELACVRDARGAEPVLLLDDVSSELDPERTGAVFEFLHETKSQVFVTTTRPELFATPRLEGGARVDFRLVAGAFA
ncbi:MAG TPA: DNA replication and repair protein RecF [Polyangiaceae bacterium]|nr:DNA replication and repair protein RecF [Polyangiaceae bacterium]